MNDSYGYQKEGQQAEQERKSADHQALVNDKNLEWQSICDWLDSLTPKQRASLRKLKPVGMIALRLGVLR